MIRQWLFFFFLLACLTGCQNHFYRVQEDTLYLYINYPEADSVQLYCSFDDYKAHPAKQTDDGLWEVSVPLTSEFTYFYIVDGDMFIPLCKLKEKDDFGSENCIFIPDL